MVPRSRGLDRQDIFWLLSYSVLLLASLLFHEIGHDEAQAWGIGRSASSPLDAAWHGRYEGHTPFWHSILWVLSLIGGPVTMQVFAAFCGIVAGALLLRDRPFPRSICVLLLFGSYFIYEYTIVPRPYVIVLLLSAILATGIYNQNRSCIYSSVLCGLIAFTSAFGAVVSAPLMMMVLWDRIKLSGGQRHLNRDVLISILIYATFFILTVWTVVFPIEARSFESDVLSGAYVKASNIPATLIKPVFPHYDRLPLGVGHWLSTSEVGRLLVLACALVSLFCVALLVSIKRSALFAWILAVVGVAIAVQIVGKMSERQIGQLFLVALLLVWSTRHLVNTTPNKGIGRNSFYKLLSGSVLCLVLMYHALIGIAVTSVDLTADMTPWKRMSAHLDEITDENTVFITDNAYSVSALLAYQDAQAYDIRCDCWTRYGRWQLPADPSKRLTPLDFEKKWCELEANGQNVVALIARSDWWVPDERHEVSGTFAKGERGGEFNEAKLFRLTKTGFDHCTSLIEKQ